MSITVDLEIADPGQSVPSRQRLSSWVEAALTGITEHAELSVKVVTPEESSALNGRFRERPVATNVLAFPAELPAELEIPLLGDLVICRRIVEQEAAEQGKSVRAHWVHMVVHGTLHLMGYDHQTDRDAERMEAREVQILAALGYADPYEEMDCGDPSARPAVI